MPNIARLNDLLDASGHKTCTLEELKDMLRKRVATISPNAFLFDVRHFFKDSRYIQQVADNYKDIVLPLIDNIKMSHARVAQALAPREGAPVRFSEPTG